MIFFVSFLVLILLDFMEKWDSKVPDYEYYDVATCGGVHCATDWWPSASHFRFNIALALFTDIFSWRTYEFMDTWSHVWKFSPPFRPLASFLSQVIWGLHLKTDPIYFSLFLNVCFALLSLLLIFSFFFLLFNICNFHFF